MKCEGANDRGSCDGTLSIKPLGGRLSARGGTTEGQVTPRPGGRLGDEWLCGWTGYVWLVQL